MVNFITLFTIIQAAFAVGDPLPRHVDTQHPLGIDTAIANPSSHELHELSRVIDSSPLLSLHRDIVNIPSISGNENEVGHYIIDFLQRNNFTVVKQPVQSATGDRHAKERFNIYAYIGNNSLPDILLTSHIDTVPPYIPYGLTYPNINTSENDRRLVTINGRGTVDAKGSVAAQIFAVLETIAQHGDTKSSKIPPSLGLLFVVGEENSGLGMKTFSDSEYNTSPPSFHTVIFGEPTELSLVSGHKGGFGFTITSIGKAAHSGYPWKGRNAISALLPVASFVEKLGDIAVEEGGLPSSAKYGNTTINLGVIHGGVAGNVVPAVAQASFLVRLAAGTPDDAKEIVYRAVRKLVEGDDADVRVDFVAEGTAPVDLDADVDGFNVTTVNYGTDVRNLKIRGRGDRPVKRYLYGPGSILVAHSDVEALTVGDLEDAVEGYRKLIEHALGRD
ncbi:putative carboxypeptidase [Talaromyces proteolyticus]|uniref:Carboxypeptidase n=1 Tax=Talaromyces proteolyticus TaxID=1131652 RepID=A0AAD4PXY0_9EURO|nr:putative carboxypeptidase [Talaromyces proteolyticus]KAH8693819.1 putative carboxypeptidase [Talaromyces proteolyticus]